MAGRSILEQNYAVGLISHFSVQDGSTCPGSGKDFRAVAVMALAPGVVVTSHLTAVDYTAQLHLHTVYY